MSWLIVDDTVSYINADSIDLAGNIPVNIYKTVFTKERGTFLVKSAVKTEHGKIYGDSQDIANHIVKAYRANTLNKNMGVLLSGGRGLGKTLTTRLIISQLMKDHPVILVSDYTPDLPEFLEQVKDCVILMDEFEKFMGGNANGSDNEEDETKQESILSVLDGNVTSTGNLFLLTCNEVDRLDPNLLSRPGRIRYHYRYQSESADVIRAYCQDNLNRKEIIPQVIKALGLAPLVSLDILAAFVDELNLFEDKSPEDVIKYLNIETDSEDMTVTVTLKMNGGKKVSYYRNISNKCIDYDTFRITAADYRKYQDDEKVPNGIELTFDENAFPTHIYEKEPIDPTCIIINDYGLADDVSVESAYVTNNSYTNWTKAAKVTI